MKPKILHLTLKKKWFDMIASGEKKEEYREIKPHWASRLLDFSGYHAETKDDFKNLAADIAFDVRNGHNASDVFKAYFTRIHEFDTIVFRNGYASNAPTITVECLGIDIGPAVSEWSDNWQGNAFRIKLGKIISKHI